MNQLIESIERRQLRQIPDFRVGDRVRVHFQVVEGNRRRTQVFEGVAIKRQGAGARETFTVRKLSFGIGVERTFPLHSPKIERIEIAGRGDVRKAKLYYLRGRVGRRARIRERSWVGPEEEEALPAPAAGEPQEPEQPEPAAEEAREAEEPESGAEEAFEQAAAAEEAAEGEAQPAEEAPAADQATEAAPAGEVEGKS